MAIGWLDVVRFADTVGYHSFRSALAKLDESS
jgi:hypothetical protein